MKRTQVRSTSIRSVGYDRSRKILEIEFENRHVYMYFKVPLKRFRELMEADSIGAYVNKLVRGKYECLQVC